MKKFIAIATIALAVASLASAQTAPAAPAAPAIAAQQTVKVEGKLALINGRIGLKQGDKTYYLNNVGRLSGFVDGLKEGATVKAEGYACPIDSAPEYSNVMVTKLTVGGKDYDLSQGGFGNRGGMMGGRGFGNAGCDGTCDGFGASNATGRTGRAGGRGGMMGGRR